MLHSNKSSWPHVTDGARGGSAVSSRCEHPSYLRDRCPHLSPTGPGQASVLSGPQRPHLQNGHHHRTYFQGLLGGLHRTIHAHSLAWAAWKALSHDSYDYPRSCALPPGSGLWGSTHPRASLPFPAGTSGSAQGSASQWQWPGLSSPICLGGI